jgi:hypothetical protein
VRLTAHLECNRLSKSVTDISRLRIPLKRLDGLLEDVFFTLLYVKILVSQRYSPSLHIMFIGI